jgi:glycosyltransferase involved in cell wall biosynthesis
MPLISVIIPAYNAQKTIRETIESVLNQTFKDFEIIVIDDGSQDSTVEIVSAFSDPRLRLFSYPNAGVSATRNRGLAQANSEFISFLDADDLWTPDKLEAQLRALEANPQAAVAYSWTDYIDESSQFLHPGNHPTATGMFIPNC